MIYSNRESGDGRYDAAILPKDRSRADLPGIILEFKSVGSPEQLDREAETPWRRFTTSSTRRNWNSTVSNTS